MPDSAKRALRSEIRFRIAALEESVCQSSDRALFFKLLELPEYHRAETLFAYVSVRKEVDTVAILEYAFAQGKRVALPVLCEEPGKMIFAAVSSRAELTEGRFGIPEPKQGFPPVLPDHRTLILVPALCYDRFGFRLGQGGGYYDRWLANLCPGAVTVGLCRDCLLQPQIPHLSHDIAVDYVVTEEKILRLPKKPQ